MSGSAHINKMWKLTKPILFRMDPERAHNFTMRCLKMLPSRSFSETDTSHSYKFSGIEFMNPVGLAAGMDKNAECLLAWQSLGFGFVEVGTVTALEQAGNPKPRLFRIKEHRALFNRMGFNNDGAQIIAKRIAKQRQSGKLKIPIGVNIGKSAVVPLQEAALDYAESFTILADLADYIVINVSSPNTANLRMLQESNSLSRILEPIASKNARRATPKALLVKLAPDLDDREAIGISKTAIEAGASGLIVSNTTIHNLGVSALPEGGGGLSGAPLFNRSTSLLALVRQAIGPKPLLIGSGGIMSANDAIIKMENGANLVQVYSGLVYHGPELISQCISGIAASSPRL